MKETVVFASAHTGREWIFTSRSDLRPRERGYDGRPNEVLPTTLWKKYPQDAGVLQLLVRGGRGLRIWYDEGESLTGK